MTEIVQHSEKKDVQLALHQRLWLTAVTRYPALKSVRIRITKLAKWLFKVIRPLLPIFIKILMVSAKIFTVLLSVFVDAIVNNDRPKPRFYAWDKEDETDAGYMKWFEDVSKGKQ